MGHRLCFTFMLEPSHGYLQWFCRLPPLGACLAAPLCCHTEAALLGTFNACGHKDEMRKQGLTVPCHTAFTKTNSPQLSFVGITLVSLLGWRQKAKEEICDLPKTTGQHSDSNPALCGCPVPSISFRCQDFPHISAKNLNVGQRDGSVGESTCCQAW